MSGPTTRCDHRAAVPVESTVTGEILAALCPTCDAHLPAELLGCPHGDLIEISAVDQPPGLYLCQQCGTAGRYKTVDPTPYKGIIGYWTDTPKGILTIPEAVTPEQLQAFAAKWARTHAERKDRVTILGPPTTTFTGTTP